MDHTPARTLKYIYDARTNKEELYDVTRDPHDQNNMFPVTDRNVIQELRAALGVRSIHPGT